jgi:uncharacterized protein with HEPN domain
MRSDSERVLDILEAIENIKKYCSRGANSFYSDELLQSWIVRNLQIIGEAANLITEETQARFPKIPWKKIIGMRHVLVHGYFEIDLDVVWSVIENDLSFLETEFIHIAQELKLQF